MIVVFGSTGSTGPHLVKALRAAGQHVRAVARDVEKARGALGAGVEVVHGDLEKPETYRAALTDAAGVYCAVGGPAGTTELVTVESRLVDEAKAAGVRRYVKVSGIDAAPDAPARIQRWHGAIEAHLVASGVPYTILEPTFFMQNFLGLAPAIQAGVLPLPTGESRCSLIDSRDIADVAAKVLTSPGHEGARYTLTGPAAVSHGDVARVLSRELGREVRFVDVPPEGFRGSLVQAGMPGWFADLLTDVYVTVFAAGGAARVTDDVRRVTGKGPRSIEDFVREHRAAFGG